MNEGVLNIGVLDTLKVESFGEPGQRTFPRESWQPARRSGPARRPSKDRPGPRADGR